ncbi:54S ribosomal protein L4 mitochondrial [Spiromyces aspiralis]|uniref:54S ribosomal protein L4 mitochondrial n=1 Tax=Spiromyces aspiralis TaxID=68401 RepID=A0ACC1HT52_9FUNG|nr:54S ribosomal protein L4 mitochondrial [Spiromyces aspiralis]
MLGRFRTVFANTQRAFAARSNGGFKPRGFEEFFENGQALPKEQPQTELRNKSWEDLHKLWYILIKERNMLASQKEEAKRAGITYQFFSNTARIIKCKKSMARIKTVLNERRLAYEQVQRERKNNAQKDPSS